MPVVVRGNNEIASKLRSAFPAAFPRISQSVGYELARIMAVYPGRVKYPISWTSSKQRRWYFWYRYQMEKGRAQARSIRLGTKRARMRKVKNFLPYQRFSDQTSEQLGSAWRVDRAGNDAKVSNPVSYAAWVQGGRTQQGFHKNTGWKNTQQGIEELMRGRRIKDIFRQELMTAMKGLL